MPHELVPHFRNGVPPEVLQQSPHITGAEQDAHSHPGYIYSSDHEAIEEQQVHSRASSIHELLNPSSSESKPSASASSTHEGLEDTSPVSSFERSQEHAHPKTTETRNNASAEQDGKISNARKRAHAEMVGSVRTTNNAPAQPASKPVSQVSTVRLSMTAEGAVKIRTSDQETPSPPKERASAPDLASRRSSGSQISKSAVCATELEAEHSPLPVIPRVADGKLGRSRDARTWEFYCDSEARDSLSSHAEHERNGSAVGAINLIRSQSQRQQRQMLAPVASRNNLRAPAPLGSNGQRSKPKLARAKSSLARLQGGEVELGKSISKGSRPEVARSASGDSDKENWAPGTHSSQNHLRRTHLTSHGRAVLTENDIILSFAGKLDGKGNRSGGGFDEKENSQPAGMRMKKGSDLDCVQGLLSLRYG
jgi:hypothetical protein